MSRIGIAVGLIAVAAHGEVRTMTLREAVARAAAQNPDVAIARYNEQIAVQNARVARAPFTPRIAVGSGLAYSSGFPMSIEGSSPSIFQAQAIQSIYNRPLSFRAAAARENVRIAAIDTEASRDDVVFRAATLFLDAERLNLQADAAARQVDAFEKVADVVRARVQEGRELDIENRRAALNVAQASQRAAALKVEADAAETNLAIALGYSADDRVRPDTAHRTPIETAKSESDVVDAALSSSKEVRRIEASIRAKALEVQAGKAGRYPQLDLVAQYALFAKFNHYEDYFRSFQRHNGQLGVSITLPIFPGTGHTAEAARAELESSRLRTQLNAARERVTADVRRSYEDVRVADGARDVARMDLDLSREQLNILLEQFQEGRASLRQIEEARTAENLRWMNFYDAQATVERARLNLLRQTGDLLAALK